MAPNLKIVRYVLDSRSDQYLFSFAMVVFLICNKPISVGELSNNLHNCMFPASGKGHAKAQNYSTCHLLTLRIFHKIDILMTEKIITQ